MKQLTKMGMLLAFGGILASCSNDNIDTPNLPNQGLADGNDMYMTINLNLPSVDGTRASLVGYEDGETDGKEYAVKNVYLYLFAGTSEATATYLNIKDAAGNDQMGGIPIGITANTPDATTTDDITSKLTATFQLNASDLAAYVTETNGSVSYSGTDRLYGLIVVNKGAKFPNATSNQLFAGETGLNASIMHYDDNSTPAYKAQMLIDGSDEYFTMTNAPQATGDDNGTVNTLVEIKVDKFAKSPAQATEAAATFYVQRGVAKVRVDKANDLESLDEITPVGLTGKVKLTAWTLDVTNTGSFPVQSVSQDNWANWKARNCFYASATSGTTNFVNHIWWGIDPNYEGAEENNYTTGFNSLQATSDPSTSITNTMSSYAYCLENTMLAKQQKKGQTTRVVFAAQYTLPEEESACDFIMYPGSDKACKILAADMKDGYTQNNDKYYSIAELIKDEKQNEYMQKLGIASNAEKVYYYKDGKTYYATLIRHFDDYEAGLGNAVINTAENYDESLHLGRYGVLRNNVYDIRVQKVFGYGKPTIPVPDPDDPDDKPDPVKYNVQCSINVLAWAKREYNYDLK